MGCHSASCDPQFPLKHPGCHSPSGRAGIPETSRLACVGVQWPAAGMRNTSTQGGRGKEVILKHQERPPDHLRHKAQGTDIPPPLNTHSCLWVALSTALLLLLVYSCPPQRLQQHQHWASLLRTSQWKIWCIKARFCTAAHALIIGHMPAEIQHGSSCHQIHDKSTNPLVKRRQISNNTQQHKLYKLLLPRPAELTSQEPDVYLSSLKF